MQSFTANFCRITARRAPVVYMWFHEVLSRFISGAATAFLAVSGGTTLAKTVDDFPALSIKAIGIICLTGGAVEMMRYLKDNALPKFTIDQDPVKITTETTVSK